MDNECCATCQYFHRLKKDFVRGVGFTESFCCDVLLHFDKDDENTFVLEVTDKDMCEMFEMVGKVNKG